MKVFIVGPTRATCVNIAASFDVSGVETVLMREKSAELLEAADFLKEKRSGFGLLANTGTGKTLAMRPICERVLGVKPGGLLVDLVTREHEATDYTWRCDVVVVTSGVARQWIRAGKISSDDFVIVDEIHQTSTDLELTLALAKFAGIPVSWASATVEPKVYEQYLGSATVVSCDAFDAERQARVFTYNLDDGVEKVLASLMPRIEAERRGVAVFVTTRAQSESYAKQFGEKFPAVCCDFYHGGEAADKLAEYIKNGVVPPFVIFMTPAGQSSLNLHKKEEDGSKGPIDTVVIMDQRYREVVVSGVAVLQKTQLPDNDLLQMAGRVHGRAFGGEVHLLTNRYGFDLTNVKPTVPDFELAGDLEQVALTCARLGIDLAELETIGQIDKEAYARIVARLKSRRIIFDDGNLTRLGEQVEALPVAAMWAELLVVAREQRDYDLFLLVAAVAAIESLRRLVRNWDGSNQVSDYRVTGSDHLTAYQIVAEAIREHAGIGKANGNGGVDFFFRSSLYDWTRECGFSDKAIKEAAMALRSILQKTETRLTVDLPVLDDELKQKFFELLASVQSLETVVDGNNRQAGTVFAAAHGSAGESGVVVGDIRFWTDKRGRQRSSIEGTRIPDELVTRYAVKAPISARYNPETDLVRIEYKREFGCQNAGTGSEELTEAPEALVPQAVSSFAEALARQALETNAVKEINVVLSDLYRRSQGQVRDALSLYDIQTMYVERLGQAHTASQLLAQPVDLTINLRQFSSSEDEGRIRCERPDCWAIAGEGYALQYEWSSWSFKGVKIALPRTAIAALSQDQLPSWEGVGVRVMVTDEGYNDLYVTLPDADLDQLWQKIEAHRRELAWRQFKEASHGDYDRKIEVAYGASLPELPVAEVWDGETNALAYPSWVYYDYTAGAAKSIWHCRWSQTEEAASSARQSAEQKLIEVDAAEDERRNFDELCSEAQALAGEVEALRDRIDWEKSAIYGLSREETHESRWGWDSSNGLRGQIAEARKQAFGEGGNWPQPRQAIEALRKLRARLQSAIDYAADNIGDEVEAQALIGQIEAWRDKLHRPCCSCEQWGDNAVFEHAVYRSAFGDLAAQAEESFKADDFLAVVGLAEKLEAGAAELEALVTEFLAGRQNLCDLLAAQYSVCPACGQTEWSGESGSCDCLGYEEVESGTVLKRSLATDGRLLVSVEVGSRWSQVGITIHDRQIPALSEIQTEVLWTGPSEEEKVLVRRLRAAERQLEEFEADQKPGWHEVVLHFQADPNRDRQGRLVADGELDDWQVYNRSRDQHMNISGNVRFTCNPAQVRGQKPKAGEQWICEAGDMIALVGSRPVLIALPRNRVDSDYQFQLRKEVWQLQAELARLRGQQPPEPPVEEVVEIEEPEKFVEEVSPEPVNGNGGISEEDRAALLAKFGRR